MTPADPLAELRDLHLPVEPSWWPPAPGWWLLLLAVVLSGWLLRRWLGNPKRRRYRQARHELRLLRDDPRMQADIQAYAAAVSSLLKRYAMAEFGRDKVAGLAGKRWREFLAASGGLKAFAGAELAPLGEAAYMPGGVDLDRGELTEQAFIWLDVCRRSRHV